MAYALVGSLGSWAVSVAVPPLPAWGAGATRVAGDLLLGAYISQDGSSTSQIAAPIGWTTGPHIQFNASGSDGTCVTFYKIAAGGDAVPVFPAPTTGDAAALLAEFSGNASSGLVDQSGTGNFGSHTTSASFTTSAADAQIGDLVWVLWLWGGSSPGAFSDSFNNGASASSSTVALGTSLCGNAWGITTGNTVADTDSWSTTTASHNSNGVIGVIISFSPATVAAFLPRPLIISQAVQRAANW